MPDTVDMANDFAEQHRARSVAAARAPIAAGQAGECDDCGDEFPRVVLIDGQLLCARCRDRRERRR